MERDVDPFVSEIIRNYLLSAVREMTSVTIRSAYSTCFSEAVDFSCALFDDKGRLFAQDGLPVHIGSLFDPIETILQEAGELREGDVILHNDPFSGGSHQADVVVAMPIFWQEALVGISVNRGHWSDIGGMAAGGWSGTARHVVQEALRIPVCKLYRAGTLNHEIQQFILKNVRVPHQIWGDIQAQIASARAASDRMHDLIRRYGLARVKASIQHTLDYACRRFREQMEVLPNGVFRAEDVLDDDGFGGGPYRIVVSIEKSAEKIVVDFAGSDNQVRGPANLAFSLTKGATYAALKAIVDPETPINSGILDLIEVRAPLGSLVNPTYPSPMFFGTGDPSGRVCETVMRCWIDAVPSRVAAGSHSSGHNATGSGVAADGTEFLWYMFGPGGVGARQDRDGLNADWHTMASCANESVEIWEARYPLRSVKRELRTDSGGPGRRRGGLGDERVFECLADTWVAACVDRAVAKPWGVHGGLSGSPNELAVERDGAERSFPSLFGVTSASKFSDVPLRVGDRFVVKSAGGGGYGDPSEREPELVASDVLEGYVSRDAAKKLYRVVVSADGTLDRQATGRLRRR